uniref:Uncharacterized protein n=2 Tax=Oryza sativa subsp. japonica TaxID=39947 RepID=Q53NI7_ORYSJ|nr:hypothetical protein LOC_Os11g08720 [Oryza sativa Japonica Group]ABA91891.1 hypothetical protein LOC_Os11g08720 [Oryza sativa Japonica Group]
MASSEPAALTSWPVQEVLHKFHQAVRLGWLHFDLLNILRVWPVLDSDRGALFRPRLKLKLFLLPVDMETDTPRSHVNVGSCGAKERTPQNERRLLLHVHVQHHKVNRDEEIPYLDWHIVHYPCRERVVEDLGPDGNGIPPPFNNFQDRIDYAVQHALINQSGVLVNTLTNMVKSLVNGIIAKHQATGPVYLPGGVFPNYRPLVTGNQQGSSNVPPVQPAASVSAPAPTAPSSAQRQMTNPRLLTREQPQHGGQNVNRLTQEQVAAMFLPNPPTADPVQSLPNQ